MKRLLIIALILLVPAVVLATKPVDGEHKAQICHRTSSVTNPYVRIEVDYSAIDGQGHDDHSHHIGPVPTSQEEAQIFKNIKTKWGDIYGPVEGVTDGLNWTEGQAIFENGCKYIEPEVCPTDKSLPANDPDCSEEEPETPDEFNEDVDKVKPDESFVIPEGGK